MLWMILAPWVLLPCVFVAVVALCGLAQGVRGVQGLLAQRKRTRGELSADATEWSSVGGARSIAETS